jgi:hypothetical protein
MGAHGDIHDDSTSNADAEADLLATLADSMRIAATAGREEG